MQNDDSILRFCIPCVQAGLLFRPAFFLSDIAGGTADALVCPVNDHVSEIVI